VPIADYIKNITKHNAIKIKIYMQDKENFLIVQLRHLQNKNFRKPERNWKERYRVCKSARF